MLDDLQLDITPRIHERIYESLSLASLSLTQDPPRRTSIFGGEEKGEEVAAQRQGEQ